MRSGWACATSSCASSLRARGSPGSGSFPGIASRPPRQEATACARQRRAHRNRGHPSLPGRQSPGWRRSGCRHGGQTENAVTRAIAPTPDDPWLEAAGCSAWRRRQSNPPLGTSGERGPTRSSAGGEREGPGAAPTRRVRGRFMPLMRCMSECGGLSAVPPPPVLEVQYCPCPLVPGGLDGFDVHVAGSFRARPAAGA